jgi:hypothetical protein
LAFCNDFLLKTLSKAKKDATKISNSLESLQTVLQLYSVCTVHKLTHIFGCDVLKSSFDALSPDIYLWNSTTLNDEFSYIMTEEVLTTVTNRTSLPAHAHIIANISVKQGGLSLQHPRLNAFPASVVSY